MRRIERLLDRETAVTLLALRHVALGEIEIIQNALGVGPLPEQIIVLEEMIVPERRVRQHERLHRHGVLLHVVTDAGVRVDDDFVGQPLHAGAVHCLVAGKMLPERPVLVE
jgi:hypothetical protein